MNNQTTKNSTFFEKFRKSCLTCSLGEITDKEREYVDCPYSLEVIKNPDEDAQYCNFYLPKS